MSIAVVAIVSILVLQPARSPDAPQPSSSVPSMSKLLEQLDSESPDDRLAAIRQLEAGGASSAAAAPQLTWELADHDVRIQRAAKAALLSIGPAAVPGMFDTFEDDNHGRTWIAAVGVVREMGAGGLEPFRATALQLARSEDEDEDAPILGLQLLSLLGPDAAPVLDDLLALLQRAERERDVDAMGWIAIGIGRMATAGAPAAARLEALLSKDLPEEAFDESVSSEEDFRLAVKVALSQVREDASVVERGLKLLAKSKDPEERMKGLALLGNAGRTAASALPKVRLALLSDPDLERQSV